MSNAERAARRHGRRPSNDVVIGYVHPSEVDGQFFNSCMNLMFHDREHDNRIYATVGFETGPRIARARNEVVRKFLEIDTRPEYLLWFDADMTFEPSIADDLLAVADPIEKPIVGGLCFAGGRTKIVPTIYTIGRDGPDARMESETQLSYPTPAVIEVGGTGSACLLIHRSVFEKVLEMMGPEHPLPWYQDCVMDGKDWGEDLIFCLRARAAGARIWINTGAKLGHRKKWTIDEEAFLKYAAELDASVGGPKVFTEDEISAAGVKIDHVQSGGLVVVENMVTAP